MSLLTIAIPTKNRKQYFSETINSLKAFYDQREFEILILDQTGYAANICRHIDNCNIITYKEYLSLNEVYRILIQESKSDFIWFLEDDDYVLNCNINAFNYLILKYKDHIHFVPHKEGQSIKFLYLLKNERITKERFIHLLQQHNDLYFLQLSNFIFPKDGLVIDFFNVVESIYNDFLLFLKHSSKTVCFNPNLIWVRRIHEQQISSESKYERFVYDSFLRHYMHNSSSR